MATLGHDYLEPMLPCVRPIRFAIYRYGSRRLFMNCHDQSGTIKKELNTSNYHEKSERPKQLIRH